LLKLEDDQQLFVTAGHFVHKSNADEAQEVLQDDLAALMKAELSPGRTGASLVNMLGIEEVHLVTRQEETLDGQIIRA
jgi:hypothetical protein